MKENQLVVDQSMSSLQIAEITGKQHKDVLRAIRNMEPAWAKICGRKFALTSQMVEMPNGGSRSETCYQLTKTECLYIATKFNDEARARLVIRWEELETEKRPTAPLSPAELILRQSQLLVDNERKMQELESKQKLLESELAEVKQRTTTTLDQSTIVAYVSRNKIKLDVTRYGAMGKKASSICKKRGIEITKINDVRWGLVSVYPDKILDEVFAN